MIVKTIKHNGAVIHIKNDFCTEVSEEEAQERFERFAKIIVEASTKEKTA